MKNTAFTFVAALATVFGFVQCKQDDAMHTTYFYTSTSTIKDPLTLFVDGNAIGTLPSIPSNISMQSPPLTCDDSELTQRALVMNLKSGKYKLQAKDSQGNVKSGSTMTIGESHGGASGSFGEPGGLQVAATGGDNGCVTVNLFY